MVCPNHKLQSERKMDFLWINDSDTDDEDKIKVDDVLENVYEDEYIGLFMFSTSEHYKDQND